MKTPSANLVHVLIGKSILETLLVGALAVCTFISVMPATFHGWGEVTSDGLAGWAVNDAAPSEPVEVQLFIDGKFVATRRSDEPRPDVVAAGWSKDERCGYKFTITTQSTGLHEARVYAVHDSGNGARKSLQLVGDPIAILIDQQGKPAKIASNK